MKFTPNQFKRAAPHAGRIAKLTKRKQVVEDKLEQAREIARELAPLAKFVVRYEPREEPEDVPRELFNARLRELLSLLGVRS